MNRHQFQILKQYLGANLLNYALNRTDITYHSDFDSITINDKQSNVLDRIFRNIKESRHQHVANSDYGDGAYFYLRRMLHNGDSIYNAYRRICDGLSDIPTSDDPVTAHIQRLCIRNYPNLLIKSVDGPRFPASTGMNVVVNDYNTAITLIKNDFLNSITNGMDGMDYAFVFTTDDGLQFYKPVFWLCTTLITRAFYDACNRMDWSLPSVLNTIADYIRILRKLAAGEMVQYSSFVGIRGMRFAGFKELIFDGAVLRQYEGVENPGMHTQDTVIRHSSDQSTYSGHVIEVMHNTKIQSLSATCNTGNSEKVNMFQRDILDKVLYSLIFSCECTRGPASSFSEIAFPLIDPGNYSSSSQQPGEYLLVDNAAKDNVTIWFNVLRNKPLDNVKIPLHRLGYAIFRRGNAEDAIVDAVIAWEGMFSEASETTFKVTASLAKYLSGPEERKAFLSRLQYLYSLRSALVHGTGNRLLRMESVNDLRREVVGIGLRCLKKLLQDEKLLPMSPQERVKYLLVLAEPTQQA